MTNETLLLLKERAAKMRLLIFDSIYEAKSGHPGGSLSITDVMAYLYFNRMNVFIDDPKNSDRDRLVLSKGHASPALYSALALKGFIPEADLMTLRKVDSYLQGHPDMNGIKGVDMSTGSLGQGFSAACGIAKAGKIAKKDYKTYMISSDGEIQEGQVWEAAMFAAHYELDNLVAFIDWNGYQSDGAVKDIMNPTPIDEKFKAFGWDVQMIDGHDFEAIDKAVKHTDTITGKPSVIICRTVKGKGVSYMENIYSWHGKAPGADDYGSGRKELEDSYNKAAEELNNG